MKRTKKIMKKIHILDSIDDKGFADFCEKMDEADRHGHDILIEIYSYGGSAYAALAYAARIRLSPSRVHIRAYGYVASAAVLVLASGDHRQMAKEAWVMVHEDSAKESGNVLHLEREIAHMRRMESQWAVLLSRCTGTPAEKWTELHQKEVYLCAAECKALGLVDEIV